MPTLIIDLTEEAYQNSLSLPVKERNRVASNAVEIAFSTAKMLQDEEDDYDPPTNEEHLASIGRGLQDIEEGRFKDGKVFFAELREKYGWQPRPAPQVREESSK